MRRSVEDDHISLPFFVFFFYKKINLTFFLNQAGTIELGGDRLSLLQTGTELGQSWPLGDFSNFCRVNSPTKTCPPWRRRPFRVRCRAWGRLRAWIIWDM